MKMTAGRRLRGSGSAPPAHAHHLTDAGRIYSGLHRIIDTVRQPLTVLDERLHIIFANRAFYRVFAVTPEETIGQHLAAAGAHRLDIPALRGFLDLIQAESHTVDDYEIEIELLTLGRRVLLLNAQKIGEAPKPAREILVTVDDVTERKRAEMASKSANWQSERAELGKSRFLSAASHGLRQPLQALSLTRGILAKKINDEEGLKLVAQLNKTANAMSSMLNSLLDIDQLKAGMVRAEKINFPIDDVLEQLRIEFANDARLHGLLWRVVPCRLIIYSDPVLLQQMIRNLLSNAVAYTDRGKILLGCRRRGDKLRIEVWDTGVGIPEDQFQAIFGEFHRLDNATGERGLGLGLAIVQRLADLLGHPVEVQSRMGKGSVFAIETPLGQEEPGQLAQHGQRGAVQDASCDAAILIVENDPAVCAMLALLLTSEGYRTATAADGKQAMAVVRRTLRPDLVIADYGLPNGLTGLEVIADVRKALGHEIPAVILTGDTSTATKHEITRRGCVQRNKPVRAEELTRLIQSLLTDPQQPQAASTGDVLQPTIFVVDDEWPVREAMRGLLEKEGWSVEVYSSGEAFLEAYRPGREGCLVVDARMPRMGGLDLLERLKNEGGGPPSIMITGHADIRLAVRAMKAGALAFLEKPVQYDELVLNIERALELTRNSAALFALREEAARRIAGLTSRERQVVDMVVEGNPNKQVAYVLGISQRTVETHRATAMKKIGVRTLSELIHLTIAGSPHDT